MMLRMRDSKVHYKQHKTPVDCSKQTTAIYTISTTVIPGVCERETVSRFKRHEGNI